MGFQGEDASREGGVRRRCDRSVKPDSPHHPHGEDAPSFATCGRNRSSTPAGPTRHARRSGMREHPAARMHARTCDSATSARERARLPASSARLRAVRGSACAAHPTPSKPLGIGDMHDGRKCWAPGPALMTGGPPVATGGTSSPPPPHVFVAARGGWLRAFPRRSRAAGSGRATASTQRLRPYPAIPRTRLAQLVSTHDPGARERVRLQGVAVPRSSWCVS